MRYHHVCIDTIAYQLPPVVLTSTEIEKRLAPLYQRLSLPEGRLEMMSGVQERRLWHSGTRPSNASIMAGQLALAKTELPKEKIGCLIHAAVSRDFLEPATASVVHAGLELLPTAINFDVSNACLGVINGMLLIANMIELGQIEAGLVVAGETAEPLVEATLKDLLENPHHTRQSIKSSFASLTIGSAAIAVILTHESLSNSNHRLLAGSIRAATQYNDLCQGSEVGHQDRNQWQMQTDSETLLVRGVELAAETWQTLKAEIDWNNEDVNRIFCHQVGTAHRRELYRQLELDINKDFPTLEFLGNVGTVSLPITFAMGVEQGLLKSGDKAALLGIGSGINSIMAGIEW